MSITHRTTTSLLSVYLLALCLHVQGADSYNQAPTLDEEVRKGSLPPVEERLPSEPHVMKPLNNVGHYGGILKIPVSNHNADEMSVRTFGVYSVAENAQEIIPRIAKSYSFSDNYKTFRITIRKGLKWSDGHPFTVEDMLFWYRDVVRNEEMTPVVPDRWKAGGEVARWEKIDDYTIDIHFAAPNHRFVSWIFHGQRNRKFVHYPKHYLKQFHIKYNENADELARKNNYSEWWQFFASKADRGSWDQNLDMPSLAAWIPEKVTASYQLYKRNPYFWAVDTEGNQLPYIDKLLVLRCTDPQVLISKAGFGEVDLCGATLSLKDYPFLKSQSQKLDFRTFLYKRLRSSEFAFAFNLTCPDPVKAKIFRDVRFRRAVSLAIDREEINDVVFYGKGEPAQATCIPSAPYYKQKFAEAYVEYDPERANRLLDEAGLEWDKQHKWRLRPDGKPMSIRFEFTTTEGPKTEIVQLLREYLNDVGIQVQIKAQYAGYNWGRQSSGKVDVFSWHVDSLLKYFRRSQFLWTGAGPQGMPSIEYHQWLETEGQKGIEPPADIKKFYELKQKWNSATSKEERHDLVHKMLEMQAENLYWIGTVRQAPTPVVVHNRLKNVPENGLWGFQLFRWNVYNPPQFYIAPDKQSDARPAAEMKSENRDK